jgi:hypothetical protein
MSCEKDALIEKHDKGFMESLSEKDLEEIDRAVEKMNLKRSVDNISISDGKMPKFSFKRSPEENYQFYQKFLSKNTTKEDKATAKELYTQYVKTLPHHIKLYEISGKNEREFESDSIQFGLVEDVQ